MCFWSLALHIGQVAPDAKREVRGSCAKFWLASFDVFSSGESHEGPWSYVNGLCGAIHIG